MAKSKKKPKPRKKVKSFAKDREDQLSPKQAKFAREYAKDLNATKAAVRAGSPKANADKIGPSLLQVPKVKAEISRIVAKQFEKIEANAENVVREAGRIALSDPRRLFNEDGSFKHPTEWDDDTAAAVASFEVEEHMNDETGERTVKTKAKLWDKNASINTLMKYLRLMPDSKLDVHVSGQVGHIHGLIRIADLPRTPTVDEARSVLEMLEQGEKNGQGTANGIGEAGKEMRSLPAPPGLQPGEGTEAGGAEAEEQGS